ncbi:MAG: aminotransferase class V-fold PLP-dependent enzyme [Desulfobacterales bacterium]|nr:aminotransferase class V-fold PLP-dependent enzyme [Desulfobacterales bacterium]
MSLEKYFESFRNNIIGIDSFFKSPYGLQKIVYADWIASGRLYQPIEDKISNLFGPLVGNTHSESSETGKTMTNAYKLAHTIIKQHVNADDDDVIITTGFGMTSALAKFQRILGIRVPEKLLSYCHLPDEEKPVVFITHMEHHSNQTPWLESIADVVILEPDENLMVKTDSLEKEIVKYKNRKLKIGSFSACSNVTGIETPVYELAKIMHAHGGYCFVDFAASAPYATIDMHPEDPSKKLDAIYFSPHKFLGGPGSSGVLIFCKSLYKNRIPDHPGGGTVTWTNPWGEHAYFDDIEIREDGGTPGFIQAIKTSLSIKLKEKMKVENIRKRESELNSIAFEQLKKIPRLNILAEYMTERLGVFSFYITGIHHNLIVKLLNDRYGIQMRGGCSCAGTYGHFLFGVDRGKSREITEKIDSGDLSLKPGWVRMSIHPTTSNAELEYIFEALQSIVQNIEKWEKDYIFSPSTAEFNHKRGESPTHIADWFNIN